jgi:hypothetical protein
LAGFASCNNQVAKLDGFQRWNAVLWDSSDEVRFECVDGVVGAGVDVGVRFVTNFEKVSWKIID